MAARAASCSAQASRSAGSPVGEGACCFPDGDCQVLDQTSCTAGGGTYQGDGTPCLPSPCLPVNDDCTNAIALSGTAVSRSYDTTAATAGPASFATNCGDIAQDIWYEYDVPCDGAVVITTRDSAYDTALAVYGPVLGHDFLRRSRVRPSHDPESGRDVMSRHGGAKLTAFLGVLIGGWLGSQ